MAEPSWFERTFGSSTSGPQWGSILGTGLLAGIGFYFGKVPGLLMGTAGGALLGQAFNELVFKIAGGRMPARNSDAGNKAQPVVELEQVQVKQPEGPDVNPNVAKIILERLIVPKETDFEDSRKKRDQLRVALNQGTMTKKDFDEAARLMMESDKRIEEFYTAMRMYQTQRTEYYKAGGEYDGLYASISTASSKLANPLEASPGDPTGNEIRLFLPQLPDVDPIFAKYEHLKPGAKLKDIEGIYICEKGQPKVIDFDLEAQAKAFFMKKKADGTVRERFYFKDAPTGTEEDWNKKSYVEKMNIAMNAIEDRRASLEYMNNGKMNWELVGGRKFWMDMVEEEKKKGTRGNISKRLIEEATERAKGKTREEMLMLGNIAMLAPDIHMLEVMNERLQKELKPALDELGAARNKELVEARTKAELFIQKRLDIFNKQGIAVFDCGKIDKSKAGDGKDHFFITCKDCHDKKHGKTYTYVATKVGDKLCITHKFEGIITNFSQANPWNDPANQLAKAPVVDENLFTLDNVESAGALLRGVMNSMGSQIAKKTPINELDFSEQPRTLVSLTSDFPEYNALKLPHGNADMQLKMPGVTPGKKDNKADKIQKVNSDLVA